MRAKYFTHDKSYYPVPQTSMEFANVNFIQPLRGGRKGGSENRKTAQKYAKNRKPHRIFSRIPKPPTSFPVSLILPPRSRGR